MTEPRPGGRADATASAGPAASTRAAAPAAPTLTASTAATDPTPDPPTFESPDADRVGARAAATMVLLCAIWGLGQVAIKFGNEGISPLWQAGLRSTGAALLLAAWMVYRRIPLRSPPSIGPWGWLIGLAFGLEFVCFYPAMALTTASRATVLIYTAPFFVALGSHLLLGDRLNATRLTGLLLALAGVAVAMADRGGTDGASLAGDLLALAAGFLWAVTTLIIKATPMRNDRAERTLLWQLWVSAPVLFAGSFLLNEAGVFAATPMIWLSLAYQTAIVASASYLAWFMLIQRHSAARLSAFTFMTPLFGVGFAALLLGETLTLSLLAAAGLIAAGIYLVNRR
jgi:drug/metabolite transporter (DMT)-like permease